MTNYRNRLKLGKSFVEIYDDNVIKGLGLCLCLTPLSKQYFSYILEKTTNTS